MSNYASKYELKNITCHLATLKSEIDVLDIDNLETVPVDLSKVSDEAKNDVVEKVVYNEFVKKFNVVDASDFIKLVKKVDCDTILDEV